MSQRQELRDRHGNIIGWTEQKGSRSEARDKHGNILGVYNPVENKTRDKHGNILTIGNSLSDLLLKFRH